MLGGRTTLHRDDVPDVLLLPRAGYAAWTALLNIVINALIATADLARSNGPTIGGVEIRPPGSTYG